VRRGELDRLFSGLEAGFSAALGAEIEIAADDLAFSLSQDVPHREDLLRNGGSLLANGSVTRIDGVGHDFVISGERLVPLGRAVVRMGSERVPDRIHDVLLAVLRRAARSGRGAVVETGTTSYEGRLLRATAEHVVVSGIGLIAVPIGLVESIRLARGGSADVL
jgi:hypothetical protein